MTERGLNRHRRSADPDFWDARIAALTDVVYFSNPSPTNASLIGVSPNDARLTNYGSAQAGMTNPLNDTTAHKRLLAMDAFGSISARPRRVLRSRSFNADTNNKNFGQQSYPAASYASSRIFGQYPSGTWYYYFGLSVGLPSGAAANGFPAGDSSYMTVPTNNCGLWEDFGSGFGSPRVSLGAVYGSFLHGGAPTRSDLIGNTNNYLNMAQHGGGSTWIDSVPVALDAWTDLIWYIQRSAVASPDGGLNGGLVKLWKNGVQQTFLPGASEGGYSGAAWTRRDSGRTLLMPTMNTGGGTGYQNFYNYRLVQPSQPDPCTVYFYPVGAGSTYASVNPATH